MRHPAIAVLTLLTLAATTAHAASISQSFAQTARVSLQATPSGCENNPGPYITLNGEIALSGASARIMLSNNDKGTHTASTDVSADVVILPAGQTIQIAKQPSRGGVGGNPWIYLQFTNGHGDDLGSPILLGRCVQGLTHVNQAFQLPCGVTGSVTGGDCTNSGGPFITLSGELRLGGLNARLILTNNAKFTHAAAADVVVDVVLIPEGQSITFAKQPPLGGAGGNPIISVQFIGGSGEPLGSKIVLGRCNQL
jgi:hypothetical protein